MPAKNPAPDPFPILGRFCDSLAFLRTVQRSLEQREVANDEATALRIATEALQAVYNELDACKCQETLHADIHLPES